MGLTDDIASSDGQWLVDSDNNTDVESVTLYFESHAPITKNVQVFRSFAIDAEGLRIADIGVFVARDGDLDGLYAKDFTEVEVARRPGETPERRQVTRERTEDACGFYLQLS